MIINGFEFGDDFHMSAETVARLYYVPLEDIVRGVHVGWAVGSVDINKELIVTAVSVVEHWGYPGYNFRQ